MLPLAVTLGTSIALALGFLWLRAAELRAGRRFAFAEVRVAADVWAEGKARAARARLGAIEATVAAWLRAAPHRLADLAALVLRLVATRALRMLRWLHDRRAQAPAPAASSKGSVSFFVSALGDRPARQGTDARASF
jgi:hypothetical protein